MLICQSFVYSLFHGPWLAKQILYFNQWAKNIIHTVFNTTRQSEVRWFFWSLKAKKLMGSSVNPIKLIQYDPLSSKVIWITLPNISHNHICRCLVSCSRLLSSPWVWASRQHQSWQAQCLRVRGREWLMVSKMHSPPGAVYIPTHSCCTVWITTLMHVTGAAHSEN